MYAGEGASYRGRKIRIAGREEAQKVEEKNTPLEAKEKVIRSLRRNASAFTFYEKQHYNMICVYGNNADEIVREAIEETKHTIFGNFFEFPQSKIMGAENDEEFKKFVNALDVFLNNTKHLGLSDYFSSQRDGRLIFFKSRMKYANSSELKGEICKEFLTTLRNDFFREVQVGLVWNVEIDADNLDYNPLEILSQIACSNLLIIVTSKKTLNYEVDLPSENIIQTD